MKKIFFLSVLFISFVFKAYPQADELNEKISEINSKFKKSSGQMEKLNIIFSYSNYLPPAILEKAFSENIDKNEVGKNEKLLGKSFETQSIIFEKKYSFDSAKRFIQNAIKIYKQNRMYNELVGAYFQYGKILWELYDFPGVKEKFDSALKISTKKNNLLSAKINIINSKIDLFYEKYDSSKVKAKNALLLLKSVKSFYDEAECYLIIAKNCFYEGNFNEAQKNLNLAYSLFEKDKNIIGKNYCNKLEADIILNRGKINEGRSKYSEIKKIFKYYLDFNGIGECLLHEAELFTQFKSYDSCIFYSQEAFRYYELSNNIFEMGRCNDFLGNTYYLKNRGKTSVELYIKALQMFKKINYYKGIAAISQKIGVILITYGIYDEAVLRLSESILIYRSFKDDKNEIAGLQYLAEAYSFQGKYTTAIEIYRVIEKKLIELKLNKRLPYIYFQIGDILLKQEKFQESLDEYSKGVIEADKGKDSIIRANGLFKIGVALYESRNIEDSREYFKLAKTVFKQRNELLFTSSCDLYLGLAEIYNSYSDEAPQYLSLALEGFKKINDYPLVALSYYCLGEYYYSKKDYQKTRDFLLTGIEYLEKSGFIQFPDMGKISSQNVYSMLYRLLVRVNYNLNNEDESFYNSEKYHTGIHLNSLRNARLKVTKNISDELLKKLEDISNYISQIISEVSIENNLKKIDQLKVNIQNLEAERTKILDLVKMKYPIYYNLHYPKTFSLEEMKEKIGEKDVYIEYLMDDNILMGYAVTKKGVKSFPIEITSIELLKKCNKFMEAISQPDSINGFIESSSDIYNTIVKPLESQFVGMENLFIIPDRFLNYIPFECLLTSKLSNANLNEIKYADLPFVIKKYNVSYQTSINNALNINEVYAKAESSGLVSFKNFKYLAEKDNIVIDSNTGRILKAPFVWYLYEAFNSDSIFTLQKDIISKYEHYVITERFLNDKMIDFSSDQAIEDNIKNSTLLEKYKYLYIGSYAIINEIKPYFSGIIFTEGNPGSKEDGFLNLIELFNLSLSKDLTIISKMLTGPDKEFNGISLPSFIRAFQYAGSKNTMISLWDTQKSQNDARSSSRMLYSYLFRNIKTGNTNNIKALRDAKLEMIKHPELCQPVNWAPFILYGNP